ncbi:hypothetical protein BKA62DRAFT_765257 [Auriculariales sp. MPI-PUGE-AT-0066]|nr:hypothetical protein BKA62DRAFT_765257 [Auriculariales sp. MPI-PUGE-AT-0066]
MSPASSYPTPSQDIFMLPLEIIDRIFQSFTDLQSLRNALLACKLFHHVFSNSPSNLRQAIAINNLGSDEILIPALREVRVATCHSGKAWSETFEGALGGVSERSVAYGGLGISWNESELLIERAGVLDILESKGPLHNDDKSSYISGEHTLQKPFAAPGRYDWFFATDSAFLARKMSFYDELSIQDLHDLGMVLIWASTYANSPTRNPPAAMCWLLLEHGPAKYAQRCMVVNRDSHIESRGDLEAEDPFSWACDAKKIWRSRGIEYEDATALPFGVQSLVEPVGSKCHDIAGLQLWNEENWPYLACGLQVRDTYSYSYTALLPGQLSDNQTELMLLVSYINDPTRTDLRTLAEAYYTDPHYLSFSIWNPHNPKFPQPMTVARIMREMFDLPVVVGDPTVRVFMQEDDHDGVRETKPRDWLCYNCLLKFVKARLWIWWHHQRASGNAHGLPLLVPNCRAGFNCDRQYEVAHIEAENHLCIGRTLEYVTLATFPQGCPVSAHVA